MKHKKLIKALSGLISMSALSIQLAQAGDVITVTSISDNPEPGLTTLREAIEIANDIGFRTINFDETLFSTPQTITLTNGELLISTNATINGPGKDLLTIDGDENSRVLRIDDDTDDLIDVEINGLTLTRGNGQSPADTRSGGCVLNFESLTLNESTVTTCESVGRGGGVFTRFGSFNLNDSNILDNIAGNEAGGLYFREAAAVIIGSAISGNRALTEGAGIYISRNTTLEMSNSTISENQSRSSSERRGGGIFVNNNNSSLFVENSTILNNSDEGIFLNQSSLVNINNSIIAGNDNSDCDFSNINANSVNQNNLDTDGSCDVFATGHMTLANPLMGRLADNGGSTMSHLPLVGSAVIDMGDDALCTQFDQRGVARPQDGDNKGSAFCDIGAVESLTLEGEPIFNNGFEPILGSK